MFTAILIASASAATSASFTAAGSGGASVIPPACYGTSVRCVGEGSSCKPGMDSLTPYSVVNVCADNTLTCYHGKCVKGSAGIGSSCDASTFCMFPFTCSFSSPRTCVDPNDVTGPFAANGEPCTWNGNDCIGNNKCTPARVCALTDINGADISCSTSSGVDCPFGQFCDVTQTCKPQLTASQRSGGASCNLNEQCGNGWYCLLTNPAETDTTLQVKACRQPFQAGEGEMCSGSNAGLSDFDCASGLSCMIIPGYNYGFCSRPENTAGEGCVSDAECGRLNKCYCPPFGGGRARCEQSITIYSHNLDITNWQKQQNYWNCLQAHGCKINSYPPPKGSCSYIYCYTPTPTTVQSTCSIIPGYPGASAYKGVNLESGAGRVGPMVLTILLIGVCLFA